MSTFGSSIINKSGKKIAPKAALQRQRPGAPRRADTSARPSVERQTRSESSTQAADPSTAQAPPETNTDPSPIAQDALDVAPTHEIPTPTSQISNVRRTTRLSLQNEEGLSVLDPRLDSTPSAVQQDNVSTSTVIRAVEIARESQSSHPRVQPHVILDPHTHRSADESTATQEPASKKRRLTNIQESRATSSDASVHAQAASSELTGVVGLTEPAGGLADEAATPSTQNKRTTKTKRRSKATASSDQPTQKTSRKRSSTGDGKPGRPGKRRAATPGDSETVEIAPSLVKMADLCKDLRTGKKSRREKELEALDWTEVIRRQKERRAQREQGETPREESVDQMPERVENEQRPAQQRLAAPQMRLVDGRLVLDDQSLQVDRHANAAVAASAEVMEEIVENDLTRRVTAGSWMKRVKKETWDEHATSLFYQGLRMFGTDFQIISRMLPGMTRRHVKNKFTKEEREHPQRIRDVLLGPKLPMDLEAYSKHTNIEYEDVSTFNAQLAHEAKEHAAEQEQKAAEAAEIQRQQREENDAVTATAASAAERTPRDPSTKVSGGQTSESVGAGTGEKKTRKASTRKKKKLHSRHGGGDEVEIIGTIEDLPHERPNTRASSAITRSQSRR